MTLDRPALVRPPRSITLVGLHAWDRQAPQYNRADITPASGIVSWRVPEAEVAVRIECLLSYEQGADGLELVGVLNCFPDGSPFNDHPGDCFVIVRPDCRRRGLGIALVREAQRRFDADLSTQSYSPEGWKLAVYAHDNPIR